MPVLVICDTQTGTYRIYQRSTFSVTIKLGDKITTEVKVLGIKVRFGSDKKSERKQQKRKEGKKKGRSVNRPLTLIRRCRKSLRIKKLTIDIDTGDVILNAQLIPLAFFLTSTAHNRRVNINFEGGLLIVLIAEIRLHIILIALIKDLLKR